MLPTPPPVTVSDIFESFRSIIKRQQLFVHPFIYDLDRRSGGTASDRCRTPITATSRKSGYEDFNGILWRARKKYGPLLRSLQGWVVWSLGPDVDDILVVNAHHIGYNRWSSSRPPCTRVEVRLRLSMTVGNPPSE